MDKLVAIKIKQGQDTYSDEIPIGALAENVEWSSTKNIVDIIGSNAGDRDESLQTQIDQLSSEKLSNDDYENKIKPEIKESVSAWLYDNLAFDNNYGVDKSLSISEAAADAEITGMNLIQRTNQNKFSNTKFNYVPLQWEKGIVSSSTGQEYIHKTSDLRYRSTLISTQDIDAVEVINTDDTFAVVMFYFYDSTKTFIEYSNTRNMFIVADGDESRQYISTRHHPKKSYIAVPKHAPYVKIVIALFDRIQGTKEITSKYNPNGINVSKFIAENICGLSMNYNKKIFNKETMEYQIPVIFGHGNLINTNQYIEESPTYIRWRFRTPILKTSEIDKVLIDRKTFNYGISVFYYSSLELDDEFSPYQYVYYKYDGSDEYKIEGFPIAKQYPFFRMRVVSGLSNDDTDLNIFTEQQIMNDIKFIQEKQQPSLKIKQDNEKITIEDGFVEKFYPLVHRARRISGVNAGKFFGVTETTQTYCLSRISTAGDGNDYNHQYLIPVDDFDYILNTFDNSGSTKLTVMIALYDKNFNYLTVVDETASRINSDFWRISTETPATDANTAAYLSISVKKEQQGKVGRQVIISKQDWYKYIHLCKKTFSAQYLVQKAEATQTEYIDKNYNYIGLEWQYGSLKSGIGSPATSPRCVRTDFLDTTKIDAIEIQKSDNVSYAMQVYLYNINKEYIKYTDHTYLYYRPQFLDSIDIVALPKGVPYIRVVIQAWVRNVPIEYPSGYTNADYYADSISINDVIGSVRGIKKLQTEKFDQKLNRINIPSLFGRGNIYYVSSLGESFNSSGIIQLYDFPSTKNRISTPFFETDKIDVIYLGNNSNRQTNYKIQIYYYDEIGTQSPEYYTSYTYQEADNFLDQVAYPIYKNHPYFRLKVMNVDDSANGLSPYDVMNNIKFYRHIYRPAPQVQRINQEKATYENMYEIYPKYQYRRTQTNGSSAGQWASNNNVYETRDGGCLRVGSNLIPAKSVDLIVHENTTQAEWPYTLYLHRYDANYNYLGNNTFKTTGRITSDRWADAAYIKIGYTPNPQEGVLAKDYPYLDIQDVYKAVHVYSEYNGGDTSGDILDLNPRREVLPKMLQLARFNGTAMNPTHSDYPPPQPFVLLHFTDLHNNESILRRVVKFRDAYSQYIDDTIHTGDIVGSSSKTDDLVNYPSGYLTNPVWFNIPGTGNILQALGNHDVWDKSLNEGAGWESWHGLTEEEAYQRFFAQNINNWGVVVPIHGNHCYYYKDYPEKNVTLIVLDTMHSDPEWTSSTQNPLSDDDPQLTWFETVLNMCLNNNRHVIIANHFRMARGKESDITNGTDRAFNEINNSGFHNQDYTKIGGETEYHVRPNPKFLSKLDNFVNNGGNLVGWICGHNHLDVLGTVEVGGNTITKQALNIVLTTAGDLARHRTRDSRIEGLKSYDAFNIIGVDTYRKHLKIMRIGMNYSHLMKAVDTLCWDYDACQMIYTS